MRRKGPPGSLSRGSKAIDLARTTRVRDTNLGDRDAVWAADDCPKHHVADGLYLVDVLDAINMAYTIIDNPDEISLMLRFYRQTRSVCQPMAILLTRGSRG
jgi:hypothetical protein